jgi:hypothetical protein
MDGRSTIEHGEQNVAKHAGLNKIVLAGALFVLAGAVYFLTRSGGLPDGAADAVRYRCLDDQTEFTLTPAELEAARRRLGSTLGMAPCPKCNKPTGQRLIQQDDGTWVPLPARNEGETDGISRPNG